MSSSRKLKYTLTKYSLLFRHLDNIKIRMYDFFILFIENLTENVLVFRQLGISFMNRLFEIFHGMYHTIRKVVNFL